MSWMDDGGFDMQAFTAQDGRPMARMSFRTSTGQYYFNLTKTEVQRIRRECRANKARILDLQDRQGNSLPPDTTAYSSFDPDFTYKKGETVHVEDFDTNRWNECAPGIHFFITRIEAVKY